MPSDENRPDARASTRKPRPGDWDSVQDEVFRLYVEQEQTLDFTMYSIHESFQFRASRRTWNNKLKRWGFNKYIKAHDMKFMARKKRRRAAEGKNTAFSHRGTIVPTERIEKFEKKRVRETLPDVATPSDIEYHTPRPLNQEAHSSEQDEDFTSHMSLQTEYSNPSTARAAATQSVSPDIETLLLHGLDLQVQYPSTFPLLEEWLVDTPSTVFDRLASDYTDSYGDVLDFYNQVFDRTEVNLDSGFFSDEDNSRLSAPYAPPQSNDCYIPYSSSFDSHSAINREQEDMAIEIAALEDLLSLTEAWKRRNYKDTEYHCRRLLDKSTQIEVQCLLGMILADTSRLEESAFWLSCGLACFIVQFDLFSLGQNYEIFKPIESLAKELILKSHHLDTTSLADCMCQMVASIRQADLGNTIHQITPQLFIHGFRFAHECAVLNLHSSANYTYDVLLKHSPSHLDAASHGMELARAYQRYGVLLGRLGKRELSAEPLLSACQLAMYSGASDSQLIEHLKNDLTELLPLLDEESKLARDLGNIWNRIRQQYPPLFLQPGLSSLDLPETLPASEQSIVSRMSHLTLPSRSDGSSTGDLKCSSKSSSGAIENHKYGVTLSSNASTGMSIPGNLISWAL